MDPILGERKRTYSLNNAMYKAWRFGKEAYHLGRYARIAEKKLLFIVGCQRSGTTLLSDVFEHDTQTKSYGEVSKLTADDNMRQLRLNEWSSVRDILARDKSPFVIVKPLVESQNTPELLDFFPNANAIWLYRDYRDVASSFMVAWGVENSIRDLTHIVENTSDNWRTQFVTEETREIVARLFSPEMDGYDAAALFWFVRNQFFFDRNLASFGNIMTCHYSEFVNNAPTIMQDIYRFVGVPYPGDWITFKVHSKSIKKGRKIKISPKIEQLCDEQLEKLHQVHYGHIPSSVSSPKH